MEFSTRARNYFIENGVHGVFPFGTSGEFYALSACLKQRQQWMYMPEQITLRPAKIAEDCGADALSVLTPMFVSQTQKEVAN